MRHFIKTDDYATEPKCVNQSVASCPKCGRTYCNSHLSPVLVKDSSTGHLCTKHTDETWKDVHGRDS